MIGFFILIWKHSFYKDPLGEDKLGFWWWVEISSPRILELRKNKSLKKLRGRGGLKFDLNKKELWKSQTHRQGRWTH